MVLLECPFCGGKASVHGKNKAFCKCDNCGVRTASFRFKLDDRESINEAIYLACKVWNKRKE